MRQTGSAPGARSGRILRNRPAEGAADGTTTLRQTCPGRLLLLPAWSYTTSRRKRKWTLANPLLSEGNTPSATGFPLHRHLCNKLSPSLRSNHWPCNRTRRLKLPRRPCLPRPVRGLCELPSSSNSASPNATANLPSSEFPCPKRPRAVRLQSPETNDSWTWRTSSCWSTRHRWRGSRGRLSCGSSSRGSRGRGRGNGRGSGRGSGRGRGRGRERRARENERGSERGSDRRCESSKSPMSCRHNITSSTLDTIVRSPATASRWRDHRLSSKNQVDTSLTPRPSSSRRRHSLYALYLLNSLLSHHLRFRWPLSAADLDRDCNSDRRRVLCKIPTSPLLK